MISKKTCQLINEQVGHEFAASIQYVALSAYFESEALPKLAGYFAKQAEEENDHALKFIKFLNDTDQDVAIPAIPQPTCSFKSVEDAIRLAHEQEIRVTKQIEAIFNQAASESDRITQNYLQWFLTEQLEEVSGMDTLLKIVRRAGDNLFRVEDYIAREGHPEETQAE
jgi:bacterioferritin B